MSGHTDAFIYRGQPYRANKLHRVQDVHTIRADEILERTRPFWRQVGITRVADITGMDRVGIPTINVVCPKTDGVSTQHGKGLTLAAARASAVMEAFERHYARRISLPVTSCSHDKMIQTKPVIDPDALFTRTGAPFDTTLPEIWVDAVDMVSGIEMAVPYALATTGQAPNADRAQLAVMSTNGYAAGANLVEAALQGLYECVERDAETFAAMRAKWSGKRSPKIRLASIPFPEVQAILARIVDAKLLAVLRDTRQDIDIFSYQCALYDPLAGYRGVTTGGGCSLNPAVAMIRAITEAAQARCVLNTGNREVMFAEPYFLFRNTVAKVMHHPAGEADELDVSFLLPQDTPTFEGDFAQCRDRILAAGFSQILLLDLSPKDIDIAVVRVFVPGLAETPFGLSRLGHRIRKWRP